MRLITLNPVFDRELRQRSRSTRSIILLGAFLALLIGVLYVSYRASETAPSFGFNPVSALTTQIGRTMFEWVLVAELVILLFIVPGISAAAVAGERDRQTLIPLQVTLVGPLGIFFGKVLASSSFVLLLMIASAPIMAVPYLVGGISLTQILLSLASLLVIGVALTVVGVACSSFFRGTQTATLAAYGLVLLLTLGTAAGLVLTQVIDASRGTDQAEPRIEAMYPNPFLTLASASGALGAQSPGPFEPLREIYYTSQLGSTVVVFDQADFGGPGGGVIAIDQRTGVPVELPDGDEGFPLWAWSLLIQVGVALVAAVIGVVRLRAPQRELRT